MGWSDVWDFVTGAADTASKHQGLVKTGIAALSTYGAYKDQQKKNEMQQAAYDDYMRQAAAAGFEAEAAVDLNLTPMVVSGVPTTKADVTDFTAVAAKGGLMSIPNRQRKRYATGPDEVDVMEFDEEVITPEGFKMETGVDVTGEQVKYDTGNPRQDAWGIWNSGGIDQEIYEFDFEIFFNSGDWMDMLRGQAPAPAQNLQMASAPSIGDDRNQLANTLFNKNLDQLTETEVIQLDEFISQQMAGGGIAGLRKGYNTGSIATADTEAERELQAAHNQIRAAFIEKFPNIDTDNMRIEDMVALLQREGVLGTEGAGILDMHEGMKMITPESVTKDVQRMSRGDTQWDDIPEEIFTGYEEYNKGGRTGYRFGDEVIADQEAIVKTPNEEVVINDMEEIQGQTAGGGDRGWRAQMLAEDLAEERYGKEFYDLTQNQQFEIYNIALDMIDSGGMKKGGRVKRDNGGIMNLGGMEKDYRFSGGFVPIGAYEKKDDVPARLSKNEFVFTADAVRAAGGGSINKGAQRMYDTMKNLEARPEAKRMTA